jgi:hypothetical protein
MYPCTATCPVALNPASMLRKALALPCTPPLQTLPPYRGGLWHCYVPCGSGPCLPTKMSSGTARCPAASDIAFLLRQALALPHVPMAPDLTSLSGRAPVLPHVL